ncbi:MAG: acyltransferase family protein [Bacteroidia bacterium]
MAKAISSNLRLSTVDMMRGIASLAVLFYHITHNHSFYGDFLTDADYLKKTGAFGWLGVQMFFVISGFVIPYTLYNNQYQIRFFLKFLSKRWLRIEPPYIVSILMLIGVGFFYSKIYRNYPYSIDWKQLYLHLFYLPQFFNVPWMNAIFWTLALEFQYYLVMAFTFQFFAHEKKWVRYATLMIFASIHFVLPETRFLTSYSSLFLAGIVIFMHRAKLLNTAETLVFIALCTIYAFFQFPKDSLSISIVLLISSLMILFLKYDPSWGKFTGKISYSLYLTHGVIGHNIIMFSMYSNFVRNYYPFRVLMVFIGITASITFAWYYYKFIEKPSQDMSKKISYK